MASWKLAGVQMDCRIGDNAANLREVIANLETAAAGGARLIIFPECILTGYCFESKAKAWPHAETIPGPATEALEKVCKRLGVYTVVGLLETRLADNALFNSAVLIGPHGLVANYRKIHLPHVGVDRFTTPGDQPFAVHEIEGLRIGMVICYDGSLPESCRVLALLGADLVVMPTNWPAGAISTVKYIVQARALENVIYFATIDRIGQERNATFLGQSRIIDCNGELLCHSPDDRPTILYADIDPQRARQKRQIYVPGEHEVDRIADRRPEMYAPLVDKTLARRKP